MEPGNLLRKQVLSEVKKRRVVFFTLVILSFMYLSMSVVFSDIGMLKYFEMKEREKKLKQEIVEISLRNDNLRIEITQLKEDPFYREKIAREEFGLAKPDEFIYKFER